MFNKSHDELLGLFLVRILYAFGLGCITTMVLVIIRVIPDTASMNITITFPFIIISGLYFIKHYCNSIDITDDVVIITNFFGKKNLYSKNLHEFTIETTEHIINYKAGLCHSLILTIRTASNEQTIWHLSGYSQQVLEQIIEKLASYNINIIKEQLISPNY